MKLKINSGMKNKKWITHLKVTSFSLVLILFLSGCSGNEPDGTKNRYNLVTRDWVFESYFINGNEASDHLLISNIFEEYRRDGVYQYSYVSASGKATTNSNPWMLSDDEKIVMLNDFVPVAGFSKEIETLRLTELLIVKLSNDLLWYSFEDSVGIHEFHYVAAFENSKY